LASPARIAVAALALAAASWIALFLFTYDSDGAFAVHDGVFYGLAAERDPAASVSAQHPGFHVIAAALVPPLRALGVPRPGHVAVRVIAGAGAAWLLLQIVGASGGARPIVGGLFALVMLCSRGFVVETAGGETVIPAAAAALAAVRSACRETPRLAATGALTTLALWLRQDNLFVLPGVLAGLAAAHPRGARLRACVRLCAGAGLATALGYVAAWWFATAGAEPLHRWLVPYAGPWSGDGTLDGPRLRWHLSSLTAALTGQTWVVTETRPFTGLLFSGGVVACGVMLLGSAPSVRFLLPALIAGGASSAFHAWFEAENFEWLVLPFALVVTLAAGLARGEPATGRRARLAGAGVLIALSAWMLAAHGPSTLKLRERRLIGMVEEAVGGPRRGWRALAYGGRAGAALTVLGVPFEELRAYPHDARSAFESVLEEVRSRPVPTVVVTDRLVGTGMPYVLDRYASVRLDYDALADGAEIRFLRREGLVSAMFVTPAASSRPETRD
jgi:hypothetical protein